MPATSCAHAGALVLVVAVCTPAALAQNRLWIRQFGGFQDQVAYDVLRDDAGGAWLTGSAEGTFLGPSFGFDDAYLAKCDDAGNLLWGVKFGSSGIDSGYRLLATGDGGVFVAGIAGGNLGGPPAGGFDIWLARCDNSGNRLWIRQFGSTTYNSVWSMCPDDSGGAYLAGDTYGNLAGPNAGAFDAWVTRYDGEGNQLWARQFGTPSIDNASGGLVPDGSGGVFLGGTTSGDLFGTQAGYSDAWLARFDAQGQVIWATQFGTPQWEVARGLCSDGSGGVFVVGETGGVMAGTTPGGIWVARYDLKGNRIGIVQFSPTVPQTFSACPDGQGGLYMAGNVVGPFGGPSAGGNDAFIAYVRNGTQLAWVHRFGTPAYDTSQGLALAGPGRVYVCGYTGGNIITGGGTGGGSYDAWVALYESCYADCNADGALSLADFACFQTKYLATDPYADCNNDGAVNLADFGCFQTRYVLGCP
jgi:hypothetical protein